MPSDVQAGGVNVLGLVYLLIVLLVVFFPILLGRRGSSPGQPGSDSDGGGGGGGGGPTEPRTPPKSPSDLMPIDDAGPARWRLRDHGRPADSRPAWTRRPSHAPDRRRVRPER
jgi:hypothetical protein